MDRMPDHHTAAERRYDGGGDDEYLGEEDLSSSEMQAELEALGREIIQSPEGLRDLNRDYEWTERAWSTLSRLFLNIDLALLQYSCIATKYPEQSYPKDYAVLAVLQGVSCLRQLALNYAMKDREDDL